MPLAAAGVWFLILKTDYQRIEKIFLFACSLYICYIVSGILVKPDWKEAAIYSVKPVLMLDSGYITMLIGMVGTSVAPWMQFFLQAAVVEKGITAKDYAESRIEVIVGCIVMSVIAFFIIVSCAGAIWSNGPRDIADATDAAEALKPFGPYAYLLFCAGLLNASVFAACILPLSTAYTVCEGLGFESGVNRRFQRSAGLLLADHAADCDWRRRRSASEFSAREDDPVVAGDQRHAAAAGAHLHDDPRQQEVLDEGVDELTGLQLRRHGRRLR